MGSVRERSCSKRRHRVSQNGLCTPVRCTRRKRGLFFHALRAECVASRSWSFRLVPLSA